MRSKRCRVTLAIILGLDCSLLAANALHHIWVGEATTGTWWAVFSPDRPWNGEGDGSFIELFGHLQLGVASLILMFFAFRKSGMYIMGAWGCVFILLVADDYLRLHERAGQIFIVELPIWNSAGLNVALARELGAWVAAALLLGFGLVLTSQASSPQARRSSRQLWSAAMLLGFFVVGFEFVDAVFGHRLKNDEHVLMVFIKTTGKLLAMTLVLMRVLKLSIESPDLLK